MLPQIRYIKFLLLYPNLLLSFLFVWKTILWQVTYAMGNYYVKIIISNYILKHYHELVGILSMQTVSIRDLNLYFGKETYVHTASLVNYLPLGTMRKRRILVDCKVLHHRGNSKLTNDNCAPLFRWVWQQLLFFCNSSQVEVKKCWKWLPL